MRSTLLITLLIALATITNSYAQKANILLKTGSQFEGEIELSKLKDDGVLVVVSGTNTGTYTPDVVQSVLLEDGESFQVKIISVLNPDYSEDEKEYFVRSLILGPASLWEVFGADFEFAAEKESEVKALQVLEVETPLGGQRDDAYKGVLFQLFSDCTEGVNVSSTKNSKSQLIDVFNKYNSCVDNAYIPQSLNLIKERVIELEVVSGIHYSELNFSGTATLFLGEQLMYDYDFERSISNFYGANINVNIISDILFGGLGLQYVEHKFEPVINDMVADGSSIEFSEVVFKGHIEGRYKIGSFSTALRVGANFHSITKDYDGRIFVAAIRQVDPLRTNNILIKTQGELESGYTTFSLSPAFYYSITDNLELGASYSFITSNKDFLSNADNASDEQSNASLNFHLKFKIVSLK